MCCFVHPTLQPEPEWFLINDIYMPANRNSGVVAWPFLRWGNRDVGVKWHAGSAKGGLVMMLNFCWQAIFSHKCSRMRCGSVSVQEAGCSPSAAGQAAERSLRGPPEFLLRNEHSFMAREIRNVWQLWLEANALFTEICVLMLLMFSFRSSGQ